MKYNRLRDFRKIDLRITSTEKFAELLGGEDAGWYHQRVQRLETGDTALTDEVAWEISEKTGAPVYALFVDPKAVNNKTDQEIISRFHAAPNDVKTNIMRQLGMLEMPSYTGADASGLTLHEPAQPNENFKKPS
ncbi:MAG: hypothetical protein DI551_07940 [Micavibrio aeruginosavorus]|uniref:Uncharacterized protein n=1 Tax=Micavibrio aeruginosavorus TaxID=349221 RepID=A0A2W5Q1M4_9BACT|nr:MAG: hypothetical protein DI551_07940 [Micavibrio aeruginosavorus]